MAEDGESHNGDSHPDQDIESRADSHYGTGVPIAKLNPAREVLTLKRWVQVGIYTVISGLFAAMVLMSVLDLHYGAPSVAVHISLFVSSAIIAFAAIELTFKQVFRLRRRSVYPGIAIAEIASLERSADACQAAADLAVWLLDLRAALAFRHEDGEFSLAAHAGIDRHQAERLMGAATDSLRANLLLGWPDRFHLDDGLTRETMLLPGEIIMLVPVRSPDKHFGVLTVVGRESNESLSDPVLLRSIGLSLGLALESLARKEALEEMAIHDELTRIYNRRYFFEQLARESAEARRYNSRLAVLMLDMDGLKDINDGYGHGAGDEALCAVAQRLVRNTRAADIVARLGGDEFAVILPRSGREGAQEMTTRLCRAVRSQPLLLDDGTILDLSVSCGLAVFPDDGDDVEGLIREADATMYASKAAGRAKRKV
ncbi:MAG: GGDEF domain-containing protein [Dehalococcoidia bacterium]